jgi:hypothetical protein
LPAQAVDQFSNAGTAALDNLVGVGGEGGLSAQILALVPDAMRSAVEPMIPTIVGGIHQAFSIAVSTTFQIGVFTTIFAFLAALAVRELPLRRTAGAEAPAASRPDVARVRPDAGGPTPPAPPAPQTPRLSGSPSTD